MTGRLIRFKNSNVSLYNVHSFVVAHVLLTCITCITKKTGYAHESQNARGHKNYIEKYCQI